MNLCGDCTYCCYHLPIGKGVLPFQKKGKKRRKWCPKFEQGVGCGIYETRPKECKEFLCVYIQNVHKESVTEEYRPDNCGFAVIPHVEDGVNIFDLEGLSKTALDHETWSMETMQWFSMLNDLAKEEKARIRFLSWSTRQPEIMFDYSDRPLV